MSEEETTSSATSEETAVEETASPAKSAKSAKSVESADSGSDRPQRKTRVGLVTSNKMHKTIVVDVVRRVPHPRYKKIVKQTTRLYVHDEEEKAVVGDRVMVMECRPLSKKKRWRLIEVLAH